MDAPTPLPGHVEDAQNALAYLSQDDVSGAVLQVADLPEDELRAVARWADQLGQIALSALSSGARVRE